MSRQVGDAPSTLDVDDVLKDDGWTDRAFEVAHPGVWSLDLDWPGPRSDGPDEVSLAAAFAAGWAYERVVIGTGPLFYPERVDDAFAWPLWEYGDALRQTMLGRHGGIGDGRRNYRVLGAIAHRDVPLGYHRDKRAPEGTLLNATTMFSRRCTGGELVLAEKGVAFTPKHLRLVVYDGSTLHGVAPFTLDEGGYRLSLTFYLGAAVADEVLADAIATGAYL